MKPPAPPHDPRIWFPAKRYGWGWGPPCCWQGWAVMAAWLVAVVGGTPLILVHPVWFSLHMLVLTAVLMVICWRKGEKLRWRWGDDGGD